MNSVSPGGLGGPTRNAADRASGAIDMQTLTLEKNWTDTPLGPRETWPTSLELSVALILSCGFPMAVRWGPELVTVYNDAYRDIRARSPAPYGRSVPKSMMSSGRSTKRSFAAGKRVFLPKTIHGKFSGTA